MKRLNFDNAIIVRRKDGGLLKGINDDEIRDYPEGGVEIFVLVKGDGEKIPHLREKLKEKGLNVEFEVVPCG